jgi:hypothetical protein
MRLCYKKIHALISTKLTDFLAKMVQQSKSEAKNTDPGFVGKRRVSAEESPEDA